MIWRDFTTAVTTVIQTVNTCSNLPYDVLLNIKIYNGKAPRNEPGGLFVGVVIAGDRVGLLRKL